jgi:steroid delta-isomerase
MSHPHPAINAHLVSIACAQNGEKEQWLSLFADDAVVHDPVGSSPHDPTGEGFVGKERLSEFWDLMIGPSTMVITSHKQIAAGPVHCACIATATNQLGEDLNIDIEMVVTYQVNDEGLITSLNAYWDLNTVTEQLGG